jgi:tRNA(Arg) A34 adenosine deaminase TadA
MITQSKELILRLPEWTTEKVERSLVYPTVNDKMGFVLGLLSAQIEYNTGFPFAAAIFDNSHKVSAVGVNASQLLNNSTAHAELLALQFAQAAAGKPYLPKSGDYTLVTSAQPCAMCMGAIYNSGLRELVIGARDSDILDILKFGQGPIDPQWREFMAAKQIKIFEDIERERAVALMQEYVASSGLSHKKIERSPASANI